MAINADDIARRIPAAKDDSSEEADEGEVKPGDHGRRIIAAIKANDPIAVEEAIRDCVDAEY